MNLFLARHNLLISITLSLAAGIALGFNSSLPLSSPLAIFVFLAPATLWCWQARFNTSAIILLCLCFWVFGLFQAICSQLPATGKNDIGTIVTQDEEVVVIGTLAAMVTGGNGTMQALTAVHRLRRSDPDYFIPSRGSVLLNLRGDWPESIRPGDTFAARAHLSPPPVATTPGTFDYRTYLASRNIHVSGYITSPLLIQPVRVKPEEPRVAFWKTAVERTRTRLKQSLNAILPPAQAALYRALLLGDTSAVGEETLEIFRGAGIMHILAISGMHMALLAFLLFQAIFWVLRRSESLMLACTVRKAALLLCIPFLLGYTMLAGCRPPVVRSFVMSLMVIAALQVNRRLSPLVSLAGAAFLLLLFDPLSLKSASFQLSFTAVAVIVTVVPPLIRRFEHPTSTNMHHRLVRKLLTWLVVAMTVTVAATAGTAPLLLYHFNRMSLVTVAANLAVEPLICLWALPLGLLCLPLLIISPSAAEPLLHIGSYGLNMALEIASFFAGLPHATLWLPDPPLVLIACYYLCLTLAVTPVSAKFTRKCGVAGLVLCIALLVAPASGVLLKAATRPRVTFIDVGHGSANLVEMANGRTVIIDGGGRHAPGFDCGARIIAPFLWHRGFGTIDDIIITHEDADHYNGIPALIERFHPERLWLPHESGKKPGYRSLCRLARKMGVRLVVPEPGLVIQDGGSTIELIGNSHRTSKANAPHLNEDDRGLVLRLDTSHFSVIFPGDIGKTRELNLVAARAPLSADVLLSPHHGSVTSNSAAFLHAVTPGALVVSSGDRTGRHFPAPATRNVADRSGIALFSTEEQGTLGLIATQSGYVIESFKNGAPRTLYRGVPKTIPRPR